MNDPESSYMNQGYLYIGALVAVTFLIFIYGVQLPKSHSERPDFNDTGAINQTLKIKCDKMMYSDDWALGYLQDLAAHCSNGGD